jgi:putative molybdopterin biosynthesis protein
VNEIMKIDEVAAYLQIHVATLYRLIKRGGFPCFRIGTDYRFIKSEVDAWRLSQPTAMPPASREPS